jgi:aminopeptidase YwaD
MNPRFLLLFFLLPLIAWPQATPYSMDKQSIESRMKNDVLILSSDSMEGRESGSEGEKKASQYILHQFAEIGLVPEGSDSGSYLQPFPHRTYDYSGMRQDNTLSDSRRIYRYFTDFGPTRFSADTMASGTLFIPPEQFYPANDPDTDSDTLASYSGQVLLLDLVRFTAGDGPGMKMTVLKKTLARLFRQGCSAVILWNRNGVYPEELFYFTQPYPMPGPVIFLTLSAAKAIREHKGDLVRISARKPRINNQIYHNIVGGIDHHAAKTIILGAHYDHLGKGAGKGRVAGDTGIMHGADDNASGTAGLLELARYLRQSGDTSANYIFVAFTGEEEGLLGSNYFCGHFPSGTGPVLLMVNFDMIGRLGCEGNKVTVMGEGSSPFWKELYHEVKHPAFRIKVRAGAPEFSDHYPFLGKQIPVIFLTTGLHPQYHTSADRSELIRYTGMADLVIYSEALIDRAREREQIPYHKIPGVTQFFLLLGTALKEL